ncbi:hypothetical protein MMC10_000990 [Thelotrema lepadinum]|nr:hypothetical protein [Thelotrema lepadinum]
MLSFIITPIPLLIASFLAGVSNAQVYWPDQIIQLGLDTIGSLGLTDNPAVQNKSGGIEAIEATFCLPTFPNGTTCTIGLGMPGYWNDNNSTWTAWLPNSPNSTWVNINLLTGPADPNKDTLAAPASSYPYAVMDLRLPVSSNQTGLDMSINPPTIPCDLTGVLMELETGQEAILFWNRKPTSNSLYFFPFSLRSGVWRRRRKRDE